MRAKSSRDLRSRSGLALLRLSSTRASVFTQPQPKSSSRCERQLSRKESVMSSAAYDIFQRHRLTVAEYYRMGETGILTPDARVELIEWEVIVMPPIGITYAGTVDYIAELLRSAFF